MSKVAEAPAVPDELDESIAELVRACSWLSVLAVAAGAQLAPLELTVGRGRCTCDGCPLPVAGRVLWLCAALWPAMEWVSGRF